MIKIIVVCLVLNNANHAISHNRLVIAVKTDILFLMSNVWPVISIVKLVFLIQNIVWAVMDNKLYSKILVLISVPRVLFKLRFMECKAVKIVIKIVWLVSNRLITVLHAKIQCFSSIIRAKVVHAHQDFLLWTKIFWFVWIAIATVKHVNNRALFVFLASMDITYRIIIV